MVGRIVLTTLMLVFAFPARAFPFIIRITNKQQQPVLIQDNDRTLFQIAPNESSEFVVADKSNYRIRYVPGNVSNRVVWGHDEAVNSLANECQNTLVEHHDDELLICDFTFKKKSASLLGAHTYALTIEKATPTGYRTDDFMTTLKQFAGKSNIFFHHLDPATQATQKEKRRSLRGELEGHNILQSLKQAIDFYDMQLPTFTNKSPQQNFLVFGDQGSGDDKARRVARDMYAICALRGCHDALVVGDNIYPMAPSIESPNWQKEFVDKFASIYRAIWDEWKFPFYLTLGNHDIGVDALKDTDWVYFEAHRGDFGPAHYLSKRVRRMQAQTAFTNDDANPKSADTRMWNLVSPFYSELLNQNGIRTLVVSIDSNYFPAEVGKNGESPKSAEQSEVQRNWLRAVLGSHDATSANWRIVYGHHGIFSVGRHGTNGNKFGIRADDSSDMRKLREALLPILCEAKVDFYLAGHDHHLQIDEITCPEKGANPGHKIVQIISGAAAKMEAENPWGDVILGDDRAFTKAALYPELRWANDLLPSDIAAGKKARRMLGFSYLSIKQSDATIEMIESTNEGPNLLACFGFDRKDLSAPSCKPSERIDPLFLRSQDLHLIPATSW